MNEVVRGVARQDVAVDRSAQCQRLECDIRPDGAIGEVHFCDTEPANTIVIEMTNYANTVAICRAQQQIVSLATNQHVCRRNPAFKYDRSEEHKSELQSLMRNS